MTIRITCINKSAGYHADPHHAISHLGWQEDGTGQSGKSTRMEVYDFLKNKGGRAYVKDSRGNVAEVVPRESATGTLYVQSVADRSLNNNLLSLPECVG